MSMAELRKAALIVSLSMGLRPFRNGCGVVHCKVRLDSRGSALWDMHSERSAASKAVCGTKTEESHSEWPQSKENGLADYLYTVKAQVE